MRIGKPQAVTATAHKLARIVYSMLKYGTAYVDAGQDYYERQYKARVVRSLEQRAKALGLNSSLRPRDGSYLEVSILVTMWPMWVNGDWQGPKSLVEWRRIGIVSLL